MGGPQSWTEPGINPLPETCPHWTKQPRLQWLQARGSESVKLGCKILTPTLTRAVILACYWVFLSFEVLSLLLDNNPYFTELLGGLNKKTYQKQSIEHLGRVLMCYRCVCVCVCVCVCMQTHTQLHIKLPNVTSKVNISHSRSSFLTLALISPLLDSSSQIERQVDKGLIIGLKK